MRLRSRDYHVSSPDHILKTPNDHLAGGDNNLSRA